MLLPHAGVCGLQGCAQEGQGWDLQGAAVLALVLQCPDSHHAAAIINNSNNNDNNNNDNYICNNSNNNSSSNSDNNNNSSSSSNYDAVFAKRHSARATAAMPA